MYIHNYFSDYTMHSPHPVGPQHPEPSSVYVDQRALRVDRVTVLERGAPHSVCLMECGKVSHHAHTHAHTHTHTHT